MFADVPSTGTLGKTISLCLKDI